MTQPTDVSLCSAYAELVRKKSGPLPSDCFSALGSHLGAALMDQAGGSAGSRYTLSLPAAPTARSRVAASPK